MSNEIKCQGHGDCLRDTYIGDKEYFYREESCEYNCLPIKCPNFLFCGVIAQEWVYNCYDGRCMQCSCSIGDLKFNVDKQGVLSCPLCLEDNLKVTIKWTKCEHELCRQCYSTMRCFRYLVPVQQIDERIEIKMADLIVPKPSINDDDEEEEIYNSDDYDDESTESIEDATWKHYCPICRTQDENNEIEKP